MTFSLSKSQIPTLLAGGGAVLAAVSVGLFSLFPGARLGGLFLAAVAGVLFHASRITDRAVHERDCSPRTPLDGPILLLVVQMGVSFWASAWPDKSWIAIGQLTGGLVAFYAIVYWSRSLDRLWWTVVVLIVCGLGLALIAPFGVDWFRDRKTFLPSAFYQYFPLLLSDSIHPNVMAGALTTLIPFPLALFLGFPALPKRRLWFRYILLVACLFEILIVVLTKSRGGYLALGTCLWLTLWLSGRQRWAISLALLAVLLVGWLVLRTSAEIGEGTDAAQAALDASTWAFRLKVWHTAMRMIGDFPFTGVGVGTFNDVAALLYGFYAPNNPGAHNLFLQIAIDLGLLGLISYLVMIVLVLRFAFQAFRSLDPNQDWLPRAVAIGGISGIAATIAHGLVDTHTWGSKGAFIPWMVMGLIVALYCLRSARSLDPAAPQEPVKR